MVEYPFWKREVAGSCPASLTNSSKECYHFHSGQFGSLLTEQRLFALAVKYMIRGGSRSSSNEVRQTTRQRIMVLTDTNELQANSQSMVRQSRRLMHNRKRAYVLECSEMNDQSHYQRVPWLRIRSARQSVKGNKLVPYDTVTFF